MKQYGNATVWGVKGTATIDGVAYDAVIEALDGEQRDQVEEWLDSFTGSIIGFRKFDEREVLNLTLTPKKSAAAGAQDAAYAALKYPPNPCKVTVAGLPDSATPSINHNGDYIYSGGAQRSMPARGVAALRVVVWRPVNGDLTVDQLLTVVP